MTLKLYVWPEYASDYNPGLAFAIAPDSEVARDMIAAYAGYRSDSLAAAPLVYDLTGPIAFARPGGS